MSARRPERRPYGAGSLYERNGVWYGRYYVEEGGQRVRKPVRVGSVRCASTKQGMLKTQAEKELAAKIVAAVAPVRSGELTVSEAYERMAADFANQPDRFKPTTLNTYRSLYRTHLQDRLGDRQLRHLQRQDVRDLVAAMRKQNKAPKTIRNAGLLLARIASYAVEEKWLVANPVTAADLPKLERDLDVKFLEPAELTALLDSLEPGRLEHALYCTAAMTGLRQGELFALRWRDVGLEPGGKVRVRRNYVRGDLMTPKSAAGTREVPMPPTVAIALTAWQENSHHIGPDELVFGLPSTGHYLDHSTVDSSSTRRPRGRRCQADHLPRPPPHLRHHLRPRSGADADPAGLDGPHPNLHHGNLALLTFPWVR